MLEAQPRASVESVRRGADKRTTQIQRHRRYSLYQEPRLASSNALRGLFGQVSCRQGVVKGLLGGQLSESFFYQRYQILAFPMSKELKPIGKNCEIIIKELGIQEYAIGRSKVNTSSFVSTRRPRRLPQRHAWQRSFWSVQALVRLRSLLFKWSPIRPTQSSPAQRPLTPRKSSVRSDLARRDKTRSLFAFFPPKQIPSSSGCLCIEGLRTKSK